MTVTELIQEIFDEPNFESDGARSDFTLQRDFNTHHVRVIERETFLTKFSRSLKF